MKKVDFYLCLNVLNILLCLCTYITFLVFFIVAFFAPNDVIPICFILLCIFAKFFLLYLFFGTFKKFFPHSIFNKVMKELKSNKSNRKSALLLSFTYDAVIMLCDLLFFYIKDYHLEWAYIPIYEILTLGGICMFYISLFGIWKIQDKLKRRKI